MQWKMNGSKDSSFNSKIPLCVFFSLGLMRDNVIIWYFFRWERNLTIKTPIPASSKKEIDRNKWGGVTILLQVDGQGQPIPSTPNNSLNPPPTQTHTQKAPEMLVPVFDFNSQTNGWTDGLMDDVLIIDSLF